MISIPHMVESLDAKNFSKYAIQKIREVNQEANGNSLLYPVYPGGQFSTIQTAINQAVSDGHTSAQNPASVLVYPKMGGYTEDLTLKDGVDVIGYQYANTNYNVQLNGQMTYTPQSALGTSVARLTIADLYQQSGASKHNILLNGANAGQIFLRNCILDKSGDNQSMVLMNGNSASKIEMASVDGNIVPSAAGATIFDVVSGILTSVGVISIGSVSAGKVLACGSTGNVQLTQFGTNCTAADAITIASGGNVTLSLSSISNTQAGSNGANIAAGGSLTALSTLWILPDAGGFAIKGVLGSVFIYATIAFTNNPKISAAMGAGIIPLPTVPVPA